MESLWSCLWWGVALKHNRCRIAAKKVCVSRASKRWTETHLGAGGDLEGPNYQSWSVAQMKMLCSKSRSTLRSVPRFESVKLCFNKYFHLCMNGTGQNGKLTVTLGSIIAFTDRVFSPLFEMSRCTILPEECWVPELPIHQLSWSDACVASKCIVLDVCNEQSGWYQIQQSTSFYSQTIKACDAHFPCH